MKLIKKFYYPLLVASVLSACGGGSTDSGGLDVANGGIGGSGSGTVTGFGSIIINDAREFDFSGSTEIRIDGVTASESDLKIGMVVNVGVDDDANADFTRGTLLTVTADHVVTGPVTSLSPLRVLSQEISVVSSTRLEDVPGNNISGLDLGDVVEVSGLPDSTGVIRASLIEYKASGAPVWQLRGSIISVSSPVLFVGNQRINTAGATFSDCGTLAAGQLVEVKASAVNSFSDGDTLSASSLECLQKGLERPDSGKTSQGSFEGFVDTLTSATQFTVNGQTVQISASTQFEDGNASDVLVGAHLEAEGTLDSNGVLSAAKIRFREARVRIEGALAAADVQPDSSVTLLGIDVFDLPTTRDDDGIFNGIGSDRQVRIEGFVDSQGTVYATEIVDRGNADPADNEIRGIVTAKASDSFTLLGVTVQLSGATLKGSSGGSLSMGAFLDAVKVGQAVRVKDATYNSVSNSLSGGEIELED